MATIINNEKGFKVIEVSISEINKAFGGLGICDNCNSASFTHKYIAVLNSCYCPKCYEDWNKRSIYYPQDINVETSNFNRAKKLLEL